MSTFKRGGKRASGAVADNDMFLRLIRVAREDPEVRNQLLDILRLDPLDRHRVLGIYVFEMKHYGVPECLIESFLRLRDDEVAKKVLELIGEGETSPCVAR